jgi:predicted nucleic acid-binding protein
VIFLDTSFLIAISVSDDQWHKVATAWSKATSPPFLTTRLVLVEFVNALFNARHRHKVPSAMRLFSEQNGIFVEDVRPSLWDAGLALHASRPDKDWSLTDCISFHVMNERAISQALTYDHHFEQAGFEALLRKEPAAA